MEDVQAIDRHNICVVGAGHVGLVAAACFADIGHNVICVDNDKSRINNLKKSIFPFFEPHLETLVNEDVEKDSLVFSHNLRDSIRKSDVIFIAVGTPPHKDGSADLTSVENVARTIACNLNGYKLIVEKSTVPVHTGSKIKQTIMHYKKNTNNFDVASNPEFLREGKAVYDFFHPDRIVIGVESSRAERILRSIYSPLKAPFIVTNVNTSELIKHASNSFLATKISFINAVSRICDLAGADVEKVALAMGMDKRIGKHFLNAGIGYGGFCFPKDLEAFIYISNKLGYDFGLLKEIKKINESQKVNFVEKIKESIWVLKGKKIAVLGLSFKPDTDDMRFAPSVDIINALMNEGAVLSLYDPQAQKEAKKIFYPELKKRKANKLSFCKDAYSALKGCDCACFLTEWDELKKLDFKKVKRLMRLPVIADGRNMLNRGKLKKMGFTYIGIGTNAG